MDDITTFLTRKHYYDGTLVNSPVPNKLAVDPICIYLKDFNTIPEFSVVVPIHNQEKIIVTNLNSILHHMDGTFELILIIDSSTDTTLKTILEWIETVNCSSLTKLMVILSVTPLFETAADNIGFRLASAPLIMEIQADMRMTEKGFNRVLERPFKKYENVIGVSGRCAHNFIQTNGVGRIGVLVEKPYNPALSQNSFYILGTCNRGPLLLQKSKLKELGYLDETNYFLDNSDHDLFARAFVQKGWVCGYVPIEFASPIADGSTRKPRDTLNQMIYNEYKETKKGGFLISYLNSAPQINQPMILPC